MTQKIEVQSVYFGKRNISTIQAVADVDSNLVAKTVYFSTISKLGVETGHYVWFKVESVGADPVVTGRTAHEVAFAEDATASTVAAAIQAVIDALGDCSASVVADTVTITNKYFGAVTATANGLATPSFTVATTTAGWGGNLGATEGGVEVSPETEMYDVTSDQTANITLDQICLGMKIAISATFKDLTRDFWDMVVGQFIAKQHTPSAGTEVLGFGTSRVYENMLQYSGELWLEPVQRDDASKDLTFWTCAPTPESISFSGTEVSKMPLTFTAYKDATKDDDVNIGILGDRDQDFSA